MIDPNHARLSITRQCRLVSISRSTFYYRGKGESPLNLKLMRLIDEQWLKTPFYGSRRMVRRLARQGYCVSRKRVRRLMRKMGLEAVYPRPRTSKPHPEHRVYPYLLRDMVIEKPNQVWTSDITYLPMRRGFMYLVVVMDWYSRRVLSWRLSNTLEADFCVAALEEALGRYGTPDIFKTACYDRFVKLPLTASTALGASDRVSYSGSHRFQCAHRASSGLETRGSGECQAEVTGRAFRRPPRTRAGMLSSPATPKPPENYAASSC